MVFLLNLLKSQIKIIQDFYNIYENKILKDLFILNITFSKDFLNI